MLLASILQQNESAIHIHTHIFPLFGCRKNVENKYMDTKGEVGQEVGDWD